MLYAFGTPTFLVSTFSYVERSTRGGGAAASVIALHLGLVDRPRDPVLAGRLGGAGAQLVEQRVDLLDGQPLPVLLVVDQDRRRRAAGGQALERPDGEHPVGARAARLDSELLPQVLEDLVRPAQV